jgi:hypothetical protein
MDAPIDNQPVNFFESIRKNPVANPPLTIRLQDQYRQA